MGPKKTNFCSSHSISYSGGQKKQGESDLILFWLLKRASLKCTKKEERDDIVCGRFICDRHVGSDPKSISQCGYFCRSQWALDWAPDVSWFWIFSPASTSLSRQQQAWASLSLFPRSGCQWIRDAAFSPLLWMSRWCFQIHLNCASLNFLCCPPVHFSVCGNKILVIITSVCWQASLLLGYQKGHRLAQQPSVQVLNQRLLSSEQISELSF